MQQSLIIVDACKRLAYFIQMQTLDPLHLVPRVAHLRLAPAALWRLKARAPTWDVSGNNHVYGKFFCRKHPRPPGADSISLRTAVTKPRPSGYDTCGYFSTCVVGRAVCVFCSRRILWTYQGAAIFAIRRGLVQRQLVSAKQSMIPGVHPVTQALLGTLVTWGFTALGSAMVFVLPVEQQPHTSQKILDTMLGFASGVMLAASYWSLLAPAIEIAHESERYGPDGRWAFVPAAVGVTLGALTLFGTETLLPLVEKYVVVSPAQGLVAATQTTKKKKDDDYNGESSYDKPTLDSTRSFRRVLLLVLAITLHNVPEGMAVGVGFGSVGHSATASFGKAVNLALGIGLQNFPEGMAVAMPLRREGASALRAFMWGQASGLVEPIGGLIGAGAVLYVQPMLPYALSFAAGAMIFVVVDDLVPETTQSGNQKLATFGTILGFVVMMVMDVALG